MLPEDRLALACLSYHRALAVARRRSSPASWRGVLTAARNVREARRDRDRSGGRAGERAEPGPEPRLAEVVPLTRVDEVRALMRAAERLHGRRPSGTPD